MANLDRPQGARPHGKLRSAQPYVAGAAVYPGDFVKLSDDGMIDPAAAGDTLLGVSLGYASAAGETVLVSDDPEQRYSINSSSTQIDAQTDIGNNCDILATSADTTYKVSRHEIDSSTIGTSSAQLTILGVEGAANDAIGTNCKVVVRINEHQVNKDAFAGI